MNPEQLKVRKFFDKFVNKGINHSISVIGTGACVCWLVLFCFFPAQEILMGIEEDESLVMILMIVVAGAGPLAGWLRVQQYESYTINQKSRKVSEILQYHPIDRKEIKKMRIFYLIRFMGKVTPFCMLAQIPVTLGEYGMFSWMNFVYILLVAFLYPVGINAIFIYFEK